MSAENRCVAPIYLDDLTSAPLPWSPDLAARVQRAREAIAAGDEPTCGEPATEERLNEEGLLCALCAEHAAELDQENRP